jgi:hypothetical protein
MSTGVTGLDYSYKVKNAMLRWQLWGQELSRVNVFQRQGTNSQF